MGYMERLAELREQIDSLDHELLQLLAKRQQVVHKVGEVKQQHGLPIMHHSVRRKCCNASVRPPSKWGYLLI
ncbi:chorismate mutase, putative [Aggregatibacter actinomycetemcomitans HK1651]|nr:chorismate mutase, putative [Aggregatibacter actinomycetemcomitans HK1651]